ncbi:PLEKHA2 [Bugula neritina]|uniref:PLEKHA2 n=1 Tax=Bugula neritina TaxID=10212 RepID=A0A7J7KG52_BUGNE|nr:PLEKHA2 [Bugula neritina]
MSLQKDASRGITQSWGSCMPPGFAEFVKCYIVLDRPRQLLVCYEQSKNQSPFQGYSGAQPNWPIITQFQTDSISLVEEARKSKHRYCFAVHSLAKVTYFCAESWRDMEDWILCIKDSCRISVDRSHLNPNRVSIVGSYVTEIVGGQVIQTPITAEFNETVVNGNRRSNAGRRTSGGKEAPDNRFDSVVTEKQVILRSGFAVKQGAKWKRRFFCLTDTDISYYKNEFATKALRRILLTDIMDVKVSDSELTSIRSNLVDLITTYRTFYLQFDSVEEMYLWIEDIRRNAGLSSSTYL